MKVPVINGYAVDTTITGGARRIFRMHVTAIPDSQLPVGMNLSQISSDRSGYRNYQWLILALIPQCQEMPNSNQYNYGFLDIGSELSRL